MKETLFWWLYLSCEVVLAYFQRSIYYYINNNNNTIIIIIINQYVDISLVCYAALTLHSLHFAADISTLVS